MPSRRTLLEATTSRSRPRAARREEQGVADFLRRLRLERSPDGLVLYLTHLANSDHVTGQTLRRKLGLLSLAQRLAGQPGWRADPDVRAYLRGMHRHLALGPIEEKSDPVYRETLHAMIDALMLPTHDQVRDRAVILLANATLWPARALYQLRWRHLRFYGDRVEIDLPPLHRREAHPYPDHVLLSARDDDLCPVATLRARRPSTAPQNQLVFASQLGACRPTTVEGLVGLLPHKPGPRPSYPIRYRTGGTPLRRILHTVTAPQPLQLRDRALLLIGYGAALHGLEAINLKQSQVAVTPVGLVLGIPGRDHLIGIPAGTQIDYSPVVAWTQYLIELHTQGRRDPDAPAFLTGEERTLRPMPMRNMSLTAAVTRAAQAAQLTGRYTFSGLRAGYVRTSLRDGASHHDIAAHAGYHPLHSVLWHERREQLIRHSVAGEVGL